MLNIQQDLDSPYNPNPYNNPDLENPGTSDGSQLNDEALALRGVPKKKTRWTKFKLTVLNRGYVPLVLRLISFFFSLAALFIAGFITRFSVLGGVETRPSTVMAFVVNAIALFYLPWVAKVYCGVSVAYLG
jgi:hypothetical protein